MSTPTAGTTAATSHRPPAPDAPIEGLVVSVFTVPTETPESDGTLAWHATTLVVVEVEAGGTCGMGHGYADTATARLVTDLLADVVQGRDAMSPPASWDAMVRAVRNLGRPGIASMAISIVDAALWDLKARLLHLPLVTLLGSVRDAIPAYASGGFTSYSVPHLQHQLAGWAEEGFAAVKMKVGPDRGDAIARVRGAREAIGSNVSLFVDANGACTRKEALAYADAFADFDVTWFEEPVSADDLDGLRLLRDRAPAGMAIAAGEYGYDLPYFARMLQAGAVDILQADATRCAGVTGFLRAAALCESAGLPFSAHTAPSQHATLCCAVPPAVNVEYFFDHARIERLLFDGAPRPEHGLLRPDRSRPGFGLELKRAEAGRFA